MATVPPVQPRKHWWHRHALVHDMGNQALESPADHRSPSEVTHHADLQFVSLHGFQPHQGSDRAAHQDLISHVELEDVGKLLGVTCAKKTFTSAKHQQLLPISHVLEGNYLENTTISWKCEEQCKIEKIN